MSRNVRRIVSLEVEFLRQTREVLNSPRGWGEASIDTAIVARVDAETFEMKFLGKTFRFDKESLQAILDLPDET